MVRPPVLALACAAVGVTAFGYGVACVRLDWFPYPLLESAARWVRGGGEAAGPGERSGLWHKRRDDTPAPAGAQLSRELANLPYLRGFESAPQHESVVLFDPDRAVAGVNLVVSGHAPHAALCDMKGNVLHEWSRTFEDIWPDAPEFDDRGTHKTFWRRAHVLPDGSLLAIFDGIGMVKLDVDSNVVWRNPGHYHHDLFVDEQGTITTLSRHPREEHADFPLKGAIEEDFVAVLSPDGEELRSVSVLSCLLDSDYASVLALAAREGDVLHTNTIELMDGRFADRHPLYRAGNALVSIAALNVIAVLDLTAERVVWALGGMWVFQHQPTVLDDGALLLFDNLGERGASKVIEFDPLSQEIAWSYRHTEEQPFGSFMLGSCQRLLGGNTLITQSTTGRAFEVTRQGEIVWEYLNPHRTGDEGELIASLLEVVRLSPDAFSPDFAARIGLGGDEQPLDMQGVDALDQALRGKR